MIVCKKCGRSNEDHYRFCLGCGARLADQKASPKPEPTDASAPPAKENEASVAAPAPSPVETPLPTPEPIATYPHGVDDTTPNPILSPTPAPGVLAPAVSEPAPSPEVVPEQPAASAERVCTSCGSQVPPNFMFCGKCGTKYVEPEPEPEPVPEPVDTTPKPVAVLVVRRPDGSDGERFDLYEGETSVGRLGKPPFEGDPFLADHHALFTVLPEGGITLRGLDDLNGVYLRVTEEITLDDDAWIRMGQELLRYRSLQGLEAKAVPGDGTTAMGSRAAGVWGRLERVSGPGACSHAWLLDQDEVHIGRDYGDITFGDDGFVSGRHARFKHENGVVLLKDLDSSNGTYLRVREACHVKGGDFILMGQQVVRLVMY